MTDRPLLAAFVPGYAYATRSICDYDTIIRAVIVSRTNKTVRAAIGRNAEKTFRLGVTSDGLEFFRPWGRGSMMPIIDAGDVDLVA